jgi:enediyne biosynthesis protein E4
MSFLRARGRRLIPGVAALALIVGLFFAAKAPIPTASAATLQNLAAQYKFKQLPIAMPPGYHQTEDIRPVNPAYKHLQSWISSVGASVAFADLSGNGLADDMCIVDPRTNDVIITYAPTAPAADRFTPFVLNPKPLPMDSTMAPVGCTPGDFTGDGQTGLLVTYFGRTPILFLPRSNAQHLDAAAFKPVELMPEVSYNGKYDGPKWMSYAVSVGDFDGTGHPDLIIGNYFPDSDVLDPHGLQNVQMNSSMSNAQNGGGDYVFKWYKATGGANPNVEYVQQPNAIPYKASTGWTLAISSADLTGDGLPDVYIANDFGPDHLLYNVTKPGGNIQFKMAIGQRTPTTPKSFVLGKDSFKGMGVDFGDMSDNGKFDMMVSNITTAWGLEESNFAWMNQAKNDAAMQQDLANGVAPFAQDAEQMGLAWSGWAWDVKMGDFLNNGNLEVVQTNGFVKGKINRWPWLQELAMTNDDLLNNPAVWPNIAPGDDLAGHQELEFYAKDSAGTYFNISKQLGLAVPIPTRGIAISDTTGTGALDFAVARQWGPPAFYENLSPHRGHFLGLNLYRPTVGGGTPGQDLGAIGSPAYGTTVQIDTPHHTQISQLDGGGGGTGKRSFEVYFGLASYNGPVTVHLHWRTTGGTLISQTLTLMPGNHNLLLTNTAKEVPNS